jgi:hypothetical protein
VTRWGHRNLPRPPPPALGEARGVGRGSLLWTTGTTARHHQRGALFDADMGSRFDAYLQFNAMANRAKWASIAATAASVSLDETK